MKENKSNKKFINNRVSNILLLLIFIATIFMSVGYATINNIVLNISGTGNIDTDENVHITIATSAHSDSTINSFSGTMLNSTVNLTNNNTETFTITIYNNTNDDYIFDQVLRDTEQSLFYDNQNIIFSLNGLNRYDVLNHGQSVTFTITFGYVNGYTPSSASDRVLNSYINFKFKKGYTITYSNITTQQNYPTYAFENESLAVTFTNDVPYDVKVTMGSNVLVQNTDYTYEPDQNNNSNKVLTVNSATNNITIERYYQIIYNLDGGSNNVSNPDKYLHGSSETLYNPTKTNYMFDGWYNNSGFNGNILTSTSGQTGTLNLYAKWSRDSYENAATYIVGLVGNADDTSTNIITLTAPTGATCTNTLAYDGTTDKNLRYIGTDPCNYVKFNCDTSGNNCETWRIIGVMKGIDSNPVLKLVKHDNTLSARWHSKNDNAWASSELYNTLNNTYINSFNSGVIDDYVLNASWRIGGVNTSQTVSQAYTNEGGATGTSYIGLINLSDYFYATSGTNDSTRNTCLNATLTSSSITSTCYNNDYLFITSQNQWTINKANSGKSVAYITNVGKGSTQRATSSYYYRPVVYLKSNVKINTDTGDGSSTRPYELAKGS